MSQVGAMAAWVAGYGLPVAIADAVLKTVLGTYGTIKQFDLYERQTNLMERGVGQAQDYLTLAQQNYNNIAVPTTDRQRALFDRFLSQFAGYEPIFVAEANRLVEYSPAYAVQEGRSLAAVQARFDRAARARRRQVGRYSAGRINDDAVQFAIATALAKTDAANAAYRFEDAKKISLDEWYWQRVGDGIRVVGNMQGNTISGLNGGTAGASGALNGVGNAVGRTSAALAGVGAAVGNSAQAFSSLANGAFRSNGNAGTNGFDQLMGGLKPEGGAQGPGRGADPMAKFTGVDSWANAGDIQRNGPMAMSAPDQIGVFAGIGGGVVALTSA